MEYDDVASKERLTGRAYINPGVPAGAGGGWQDMPWVDLGNIEMLNLDYGIKRKEHYKSRRGVQITDRYDAYSSLPKWEITGDEFTTQILPLVFLGTVVADYTQTNVGATAFGPFTARLGKWVDIVDATHTQQKFGITSAVLTTPSGKTEGFGADFVIDRIAGKFYLPLNSTIADSTACTVTLSAPLAVFNKVAPMSDLSITGSMQLLEEDEFNIVPLTIHEFGVSLSTDSGGQTKVDDYKTFKLIATITNPSTWKMRKRRA
jgi:hypothetical protein